MKNLYKKILLGPISALLLGANRVREDSSETGDTIKSGNNTTRTTTGTRNSTYRIRVAGQEQKRLSETPRFKLNEEEQAWVNAYYNYAMTQDDWDTHARDAGEIDSDLFSAEDRRVDDSEDNKSTLDALNAPYEDWAKTYRAEKQEKDYNLTEEMHKWMLKLHSTMVSFTEGDFPSDNSFMLEVYNSNKAKMKEAFYGNMSPERLIDWMLEEWAKRRK